ncbi:MAG: hypothetical protein CMF71_02950 [Magnetovibrio sp.]|nr:hypothetical protein [Magnetovibrio sp.]|tara:strand:- start:26824 stop:27441 length:618 start_codon:yes stop_codon:yes gene_type:complete
MKRHLYYIILLFSSGLFLKFPDIVQAQAAGQGLMNAISYKELPQNTAFIVKPLDDSDQNIILKQKFEHLLKTKGYPIRRNAPLVFTFGTSNELSTYTTRNRRSILELDAHGGREGGEDARMRFNLFDSNSGGMFNQGKGETTVGTNGRFRLDVSIINRTNGKHHWQAWTTTNQSHSFSGDVISAMAPEMVNKIGKKIKSRTFDLY